MTGQDNDALEQDSLTLKWGTIKGWDFKSEKGRELLQKYYEIGASMSSMAQKDTPQQKELICQMIDGCGSIYLDWEDKHVTKDEAKKYVREY